MKNLVTSLASAIVLANSALVHAASGEETIFISAKAPIAAEEFSGSVSVVSAEEIRLSGATTVEEALDSLPGVYVGQGGGNSQGEIRIRGMSGEYALVLIDGKRVPNADRNISTSPATRTNWVGVDSIERIEVIRGAASSLYGADALSGVINIITKKAGDKWRSSVTFNASDVKGSGGAGSGVSIATSGKINEKLDLAFNVEQQVQDEIKNPDGTSQRSEREVTNTRLKLGLDLSADDRLELGVIYGEEQADAVSNGFGGLSNDDVSQKKTLLSVDYTGKLQDFNNRLSLSLGRDKVDDNGTQWNLKDNNLAWDIDGALGDNHYLSAGLSYREEVVKRPNRSFDDKFTSNNLFAQDVIDVTDNSALTLGFSYEDHNRYGGAFSPKVYWNTALNDRWTLKLGYSEGRIAPALREGSSDYVVSGGPGRTYQGNDNLKPEENQTLEASLSYHGEAFSSAVTVFNSDVDNLITTRDVGGGVNLYSNVEEAKIRGLESDFSWQLNPVAKLSFNYTYTDAINKDGSANDGNQITDRPEHVANLKYIQNVSAIDASVSLGLKAVSSQFTNDANSEEIAGYTTLDLGLVKPINKNLELRANIINLNDRVVLDESDRAIEAGREFRVAITGRF